MSCFKGHMREYGRVSLDRFDGSNLQSTVYFLSHIHIDHTTGLDRNYFFNRLQSDTDIFVYCSEVTEVLLLADPKYRRLRPYIKSIPLNTPTDINIPGSASNECIKVTLIPAGHCPGSVMFLLEGKEDGQYTVLYTGDFRWEHVDFEKYAHLRSGKGVKKIKSLYVDTTFLSPSSLHIPSRGQCIDAVTVAVREWTAKSPDHVVYIKLRMQYGYEPLLKKLSSRLNRKVHVSQKKFDVYNNIQDAEWFTTDGGSTQLHACYGVGEDRNYGTSCKEQHTADKVLLILPTAMFFMFENGSLDGIKMKITDNFYRACYSSHPSYAELARLLAYLKPDDAYANVIAINDKTLEETQTRLDLLLKSSKPSPVNDVGWQNIESQEQGGGDSVSHEVGTRTLRTLRTQLTENQILGLIVLLIVLWREN